VSANTQKPGERPNEPAPKIEVGPEKKPVSPPHSEVSKPGAGHLPPTEKRGQQWKPRERK
jgi:hypothetical protein